MKNKWLASFAIVFLLFSSTAAFTSESEVVVTPELETLILTSNGSDQTLSRDSVSAMCCKQCRKGKACGNSCISVTKQCHKPPGCACD